jgi:hypothetical protein
MLKKDKQVRDEFSLSLGGITTIASFAPAPAIAHDRLHQDRVAQARGIGEQKGRLWIPRRFRVT